MRIGITYDLRADYLAAGFSEEETAEFDQPVTIAGIEGALAQLGHTPDRIGNVQALVKRLAAGDRWDLVFNICEGLFGMAREAQVPAVLDAYRIPCTFSDATVLALTLDKGLTKRVLRDLGGVPTPDFHVLHELVELRGLTLPFPLFAKPVAEGCGKGIGAASRAQTPAELEALCRGLLATYRQPVLIETYLPGREFTTAVLGTGARARVLGTMEVQLRDTAEAHAYGYVNKEECEQRVTYSLATGDVAAQCETLALRVWRGLGCRDAGRMDFRMDARGVVNFIEINPLAGINPEHSDLPIIAGLKGVPYVDLIRAILESALERVV